MTSAVFKNWTCQALSCLIITLFLQPPQITAQVKHENLIRKQKRFIRELYEAGRYFDTITETGRLLNSGIEPEQKERLEYFIFGNYYLGKQYKTVITGLKKKDTAGKKFPYQFLLAQSYYRLNDYGHSLDELNRIDYSQIKPQFRSHLLWRRTEILLQTSSYGGILTELEQAEQFIKDDPGLKSFRLDMMKYRDLDLKSEYLAVSLSAILPGAGQVYAGRYLDGLISIISIAGTAYASYYFYGRDERSLSYTFGFFTALFYGGNLYGAYNSAALHNRSEHEHFRQEISEKHITGYNPMIYIDMDRTF